MTNQITRRDALKSGVAIGATVYSADIFTKVVLAQSGGPSDEISGVVEDSTGRVPNATVVAVPHDNSLTPITTTTDQNGEYLFDEIALYEGEFLYHVIARDGTETNPIRGGQQYPFIAAIGQDAIPDSAIHRWILDDVSSGTVTDSIGNADGTVNGVSSVSSSDYQGGAAGDGDGSDDVITTSTLGSFGSNMDTDFTLAFTVDNYSPGSAANTMLAGVVNSGDDTGFWINVSSSTAGDVDVLVRDADNNTLSVATDSGHIGGGNLYRVLINKVANSGSGFDIYVAGGGDASYSQVATSVNVDQGFSNPSNFDVDFPMYARNNAGSPERHTDTVLDDVFIYDDSLDAGDRDTDLSLQPSFG